MNYYIVDVFAEQKYQGNPLAVFLPNKDISTAEMQKIAKEINYSETSFIVSDKQKDGGYNVRIFTPAVEIPFAGHPSLGTAFVISEILNQEKSKPIILNLGVGQIPVTFEGENENELWMKQKEPTFGETLDTNVLADILQIGVEDIHTDFPVQVVSTGLPSVIVPVRTLEAVQQCTINHQKYKEFLRDVVNANILVFTPQAIFTENNVHVRVFVKQTGFYEDPATGSANGNLAGYLLEHSFFQKDKIRLRIEQGYSIDRPSLLQIDAEKKGETFHIRVGGKVFFVAEGQWFEG